LLAVFGAAVGPDVKTTAAAAAAAAGFGPEGKEYASGSEDGCFCWLFLELP
jgi:hypothetical protein